MAGFFSNIMENSKNKSRFYKVMITLVAVLWGYGFIATDKALAGGYSVNFVLLVRFTVAALFFGVTSAKELANTTRSEVVGGLLGGAALFAGFAFQTYALPLTTPSNNSFITASSIMFIPIFIWLIFRRKPTFFIVLGCLVCFGGIVVLSVDFKGIAPLGIGDLLTLVCAVCFALHNVIMGYFAVRGRARVLNFYQMLISAVLAILFFYGNGERVSYINIDINFLYVLYLGIFSTVLAYIVQTEALKYIPAPQVAIITSLESVTAAIFSIALGYEHLTPQLVIGGLLVVGAIVIVEYKPKTSVAIIKGENEIV